MNTVQHDAANHETHDERVRLIADAVVRAVPRAGERTLLDYGCGTGAVGLLLAEWFHRVILVDNDPEALAAAEAASRTPNTETRLLDATRGVPADLRADVIVSAMSWHHVPDLDTLADALAQIAPGGRLLVADLDADDGGFHADFPDFHGHPGFDRTALTELLARHGCTEITVDDLWQGVRWADDQARPASVFWLTATLPTRPADCAPGARHA